MIDSIHYSQSTLCALAIVSYTVNVSVHYQKLCPFSKPIIGRWCVCPHAQLMDRCTGKMACHCETALHQSCTRLVTILKDASRFILGIPKQNAELNPLTHSQAMKIRCGGILGMQRVMNSNISSTPVIPTILEDTDNRYGDIQNFPFNEIIHDIKNFNHRKKSH